MMITVKNLSDISIDGVIQHGDVVTVANQAFAHGKAAELLTALEQWAKTQLVPIVPTINPIDEQHQQEIAALQAQIAALKLETAPDIAALVPALRSAGLDAWGARATKNQELIVMLFELFAIASELRSFGQCQRIKDTFDAITKLSCEEPTPDEAIALQAILDVGSKATGPVAAKWLRFV